MKDISESLTFTMALGFSAHHWAKKFSQYQAHPEKAKQIYCNTLAVYAVNYYLQCMDFETDLEASDSWNPVMQTLADVADLEVSSLGKLECRTVWKNSQVVEIPADVWEDRIGYVAVQLDESLSEATILGFVKNVATEEVPITKLRSLEDLLKHLNKSPEPVKQPVCLSQWLINIFETSWQTVESLLNPLPSEVVFNFRSFRGVKQSLAELPKNSTGAVERGKLLNLGQKSDSEWIALLVELMPYSESEIEICIKVYPIGGKNYLPTELHLMLLDEKEEAVMQSQARATEYIQLKFRGEPEEHFSVKVALGDVSFTEAFVI